MTYPRCYHVAISGLSAWRYPWMARWRRAYLILTRDAQQRNLGSVPDSSAHLSHADRTLLCSCNVLCIITSLIMPNQLAEGQGPCGELVAAAASGA
jgi:hypothetical protein